MRKKRREEGGKDEWNDENSRRRARINTFQTRVWSAGGPEQ